MIDIENTTKDKFIEWYIEKATQQDLDNIKVQKAFVKYGLIDYLISSVLLIKDKDVIQSIISSNLWNDKHFLIHGRINNYELTNKDNYTLAQFEIIENETSEKYIMKREFSNTSEKEIDNELHLYRNNIQVIVLRADDELYLECFMIEN